MVSVVTGKENEIRPKQWGKRVKEGEEDKNFPAEKGEEKLSWPDLTGTARWILDDATPALCSCSLPSSVFS